MWEGCGAAVPFEGSPSRRNLWFFQSLDKTLAVGSSVLISEVAPKLYPSNHMVGFLTTIPPCEDTQKPLTAGHSLSSLLRPPIAYALILFRRALSFK